MKSDNNVETFSQGGLREPLKDECSAVARRESPVVSVALND